MDCINFGPMWFIFLSLYIHSKTKTFPTPASWMCAKPSGTITIPKLQHQKTLHQIHSWRFNWCNVLHCVPSNNSHFFYVCNVFWPNGMCVYIYAWGITIWAFFRVLHACHSAWWCSHAVVSLSVPYLPSLLFPGPLLSLSLSLSLSLISLSHPSLPVLCFGSVCIQAAACNIRDKPSFMTTIVRAFSATP